MEDQPIHDDKTDNESDEEEEEDIQEELPYTYLRFKPYPSPFPSPPPAVALLVASIQQTSQQTNQFKSDFQPWITTFIAGQLIQPVRTYQGRTITKAIVQRLAKRPGGLQSLHSQDLPPLPKSHHQLKNHPFGNLFLQAERDHLQSHTDIQS